MTANEGYRPPVDAQVRYTVQWFHEWSEMQRGDFLPILAQKLAPGSYVNGLLSGVETLSCNENGRPPSLFQCRVKLFRDWFESWTQAERDQLLGHIKSMDPVFHTKIQDELQTLSNGPKHDTQHDPENSPEHSVEPHHVEEAPAVPKEDQHQVNGEVVEDEADAVEVSEASEESAVTVNGEEGKEEEELEEEVVSPLE